MCYTERILYLEIRSIISIYVYAQPTNIVYLESLCTKVHTFEYERRWFILGIYKPLANVTEVARVRSSYTDDLSTQDSDSKARVF